MLNTTCPVCNPRYDRYSQSMPMVADSPETGAVYQCLDCKRKFRIEWRETGQVPDLFYGAARPVSCYELRLIQVEG